MIFLCLSRPILLIKAGRAKNKMPGKSLALVELLVFFRDNSPGNREKSIDFGIKKFLLQPCGACLMIPDMNERAKQSGAIKKFQEKFCSMEISSLQYEV